jgi:hypothetical protein
MKIENVPQDSKYFEHLNVRDFYYAQDDEGNYHRVASLGWEAKNEALSITWDNILNEAETVREEVLARKKSPLAYHIRKRLFTVGLLASYSGIPKRKIKKHLQYDEFEQLDGDMLQRYADTLNMPVEELKKV